jgi:pyruvate dehydrogenase E2 component (dihydrolipoamide acetyltransferase)
MTEIRLPQFGMGMTDGTIIKWHKAEGEFVQKGEMLCDIEAAKTTVEYDSPVSGILTRILVAVDENVPVNTPIAVFDVAGTAPTDAAATAGPPSAAAADPAPAVKATPLARRVAEQEGVDLATVQGSGPRGRIRRDDVDACRPAVAPTPPVTPQIVAVQIEPRARRVANTHGIDLAAVSGSGPNGRIVEEDVLAFAAAKDQPQLVVEATGITEIKHSMMRKTIARRLTESKQSVPHFYVKASCRIDALLAVRASINRAGQEKVSVNDLVIRAIAIALCEVPAANVVWSDKAMLQYDHVDISVAVATPRGLVTPVVRAVDTKTIRQIAAEVKDLAARGREGKLKPEEYQGGTTSISNLGMYGVEEFSAIINPPQSTIFAVGAGLEQVVAIDGKPAVATMMTVTISVDHRAVDGAVAAQLLSAFKAIIEDPVRILA